MRFLKVNYNNNIIYELKVKEAKIVEMWKRRVRGRVSTKKRGQPLTLSPKLTHESTLLFYNSFCLPFVIVDQLKNIHAAWLVGQVIDPVYTFLPGTTSYHSSIGIT